MRRTLKMKSNLPFWLESKLIHRYGYSVQRRFPNENYTVFVKFAGAKSVTGSVPSVNEVDRGINSDVPSLGRELTQAEEFVLEQRCDNIVDFFLDPYTVIPAVRTRLNNMRRALGNQESQQFVLEFMDYHFPLEEPVKKTGTGGL